MTSEDPAKESADPKAKSRSVSLSPEQWEYVDRMERLFGSRSRYIQILVDREMGVENPEVDMLEVFDTTPVTTKRQFAELKEFMRDLAAEHLQEVKRLVEATAHERSAKQVVERLTTKADEKRGSAPRPRPRSAQG